MQGLRRQVKNVAYNYTDAQKKARSATSNKPYGPSEYEMFEVQAFMNNPQSFNEVMQVIWKRLNDSGKNWRHVYKSLRLIEFLIKHHNQKVTNFVKEQSVFISTLRDFQHVEEGRDMGMNVRELAKEVMDLLNGTPAQNQTTSGTRAVPSSSSIPLTTTPVLAVPGTTREEEQQIQLAIQLSLQEQEKLENQSQAEEIRLQQVIEESRKEAEEAKNRLQISTPLRFPPSPQPTSSSASAIDDLLSLGDLTFASQPAPVYNNLASQPPASTTQQFNDVFDPWGTGFPSAPPVNSTVNHTYDDVREQNNALSVDPWANSLVSPPMSTFNNPDTPYSYSAIDDNFSQVTNTNNGVKADAQQFLGVNTHNVGSLVELDTLNITNPFMVPQKKTPTLNEMRTTSQSTAMMSPPVSPFQNFNNTNNMSTVPTTSTSSYNPFLTSYQ